MKASNQGKNSLTSNASAVTATSIGGGGGSFLMSQNIPNPAI